MSLIRRVAGRRAVRDDGWRLRVLGEALRLGLPRGGGACGAVAVAINDLLFGGTGTFVGAFNSRLWHSFDHYFIGHIGVRDAHGSIWDAEGAFDDEDDMEEFRAWGMIGPNEDPWYLDDEAAGDAVIDVIGLDTIRRLDCPPGLDAHAILRAAIKAVE
jgi:hypothetical protein